MPGHRGGRGGGAFRVGRRKKATNKRRARERDEEEVRKKQDAATAAARQAAEDERARRHQAALMSRGIIGLGLNDALASGARGSGGGGRDDGSGKKTKSAYSQLLAKLPQRGTLGAALAARRAAEDAEVDGVEEVRPQRRAAPRAEHEDYEDDEEEGQSEEDDGEGEEDDGNDDDDDDGDHDAEDEEEEEEEEEDGRRERQRRDAAASRARPRAAKRRRIEQIDDDADSDADDIDGAGSGSDSDAAPAGASSSASSSSSAAAVATAGAGAASLLTPIGRDAYMRRFGRSAVPEEDATTACAAVATQVAAAYAPVTVGAVYAPAMAAAAASSNSSATAPAGSNPALLQPIALPARLVGAAGWDALTAVQVQASQPVPLAIPVSKGAVSKLHLAGGKSGKKGKAAGGAGTDAAAPVAADALPAFAVEEAPAASGSGTAALATPAPSFHHLSTAFGAPSQAASGRLPLPQPLDLAAQCRVKARVAAAWNRTYGAETQALVVQHAKTAARAEKRRRREAGDVAGAEAISAAAAGEAAAASPHPFTPLQASLWPLVNGYHDLYFAAETHGNARELRTLAALHAVNHAVKARELVAKHDSRLKEKAIAARAAKIAAATAAATAGAVGGKSAGGSGKLLDDGEEEAAAAAAGADPKAAAAAAAAAAADEEDDDDMRDRGFTRPRVLVLLPFRHSALRFVRSMLRLLITTSGGATNGRQVHNRARFFAEYTEEGSGLGGEEDDEDEEEQAAVDLDALDAEEHDVDGAGGDVSGRKRSRKSFKRAMQSLPKAVREMMSDVGSADEDDEEDGESARQQAAGGGGGDAGVADADDDGEEGATVAGVGASSTRRGSSTAAGFYDPKLGTAVAATTAASSAFASGGGGDDASTGAYPFASGRQGWPQKQLSAYRQALREKRDRLVRRAAGGTVSDSESSDDDKGEDDAEADEEAAAAAARPKDGSDVPLSALAGSAGRKKFDDRIVPDAHYFAADRHGHKKVKRRTPAEQAAANKRKAVREAASAAAAALAVPRDYKRIFAGNVDDDFKLGIQIGRKAVKLYSDFYDSDVIVASPLGLRRIMGGEGDKRRDTDFLSSIEVVVLLEAHIFLMQNYEHVADIFKVLNALPKNTGDTDFARVREWALAGLSRHYRQTLCFSAYMDASLNHLMRRQCANLAGGALVRGVYSGTITRVVPSVKQVFHRIAAPTLAACDDARFGYFTDRVLPELAAGVASETGGVLSHTLIFVPSYFDYVRLRNALDAKEIEFATCSEYSEDSDVSRARGQFFSGASPILLVTERFHFFRRYKIRGIRHLIFYAPPTNAGFYDEFLNLLEEASARNLPTSCTTLFTRADTLPLERVVGSDRVGRMLTDATKSTFFFV